MLDDLRRRARKGKWLQKLVVIVIVVMMVLTGASFIIANLFGG